MQMLFRYLLRAPYHFRNFIHYSRAFSRREHTTMSVVKVTSKQQLAAAKRLHAAVYVRRGYVNKSNLQQGILSLMADPHQTHSSYFVVLDAKHKVIATARQIEATKAGGHDSFGFMEGTHLYKRALRQIRGRSPEECVEISGLAKQHGASKLAPLLLYRALWHHSLRQKHTLWLMAIDTRLFRRLKLLFGPAIQRTGPTTFYLGSDVVPAILKVQKSVTALNRSLKQATIWQRPLRYMIIRFVIHGLPVESLASREVRAYHQLQHVIGDSLEDPQAGVARRGFSLRYRLRIIAIAASLAYTLVRFFFVKFTLADYGVNIWFFLLLDAFAGVIYVLAIEFLLVSILRRSKGSLWQTVGWSLGAILGFAAPYAYIFMASHQLPGTIVYGLAVIIGLLLLSALLTLRRRIRMVISK